ncbi:MAG: oligosaccharide flippase family protein, partial [Clostridia bacterium]|nr:oligosaccharide flippase family protein [Clostridia bacterium]
MSTQKRFFSGMLLLTFSNIVIKAVGLLFKIPLTNLIGETGMGYFNSAYTIYAWFYMLTTAGLSVAVSMMVSEYRARANSKQIKIVLRTVLLLFFAIGLAGTLIMVIGADKLAGFIRAPEAAICIAAI